MKQLHSGLIRKCLAVLLAVPMLVSGCTKYHVLFITVDDLQLALGCYEEIVQY